MKKVLVYIFLILILKNNSEAQTIVKFKLVGLPEMGIESVGIRGDSDPLSWDKTVQINRYGNEFVGSVEFNESETELEFKFVYSTSSGDLVWENTENRALILSPGETVISENIWNVEQLIDIESLPLLSTEQLIADYLLIEEAILKVHPGTYRYNDKGSISEGLSELRSTFEEPLSYGGAYLAMSKLTALIKCDHTKVGFNNQNKTINSIIHGQADKLPFTFKWVGDKMIVINAVISSSEGLVERGSEILQINGIDVSKIQEKMFSYVAADGSTDKNRTRKMEVDGYDFRYNAFDVFFPLLVPVKDQKIVLTFRKHGSEAIENTEVLLVTREERAERLTRKYPDFPKNRDDMWSFEILDGDTGLLTINSFGLMGWKAMTIDYKGYLEQVFKELSAKNVANLIIDIRENAGGNDEMSVELFSYLDIKKPIANKVYRERRTRYLNFPSTLKPFVQTWGDDPWFFELETNEVDLDSTYYIFKETPGSSNFKKKKRHIFKGNVYMLTSSVNTSLAFYTAQNFKRQKLGLLIGQETGGNVRGINGGQILFLRLPNSGIEIDMPVMGGFAYGDQPDNGVIPDIQVRPTLEDIVTGTDVELNMALRLIREK